MRHKLIGTAAFGGIMVLGLGSAQAAMASPAQPSLNVPCFTPALDWALSNATDGEVLILAPSCTYWLHDALPDVTTDLTIIGSGDTLRRSDAPGTPSFTILSVYSGASLSLTGVSFVNGGGGDDGSEGGAIYNNSGTVSIHGGIFRDNTADGGGALYNNSGTLTVSSATFLGNSASYGGAIYNDDNATVTTSTFTGNAASGYGGAIYNDEQLRVGLTTFTHNSAADGGGALYNDGTATLVYDGLGGNVADWGGGIYNDDVLNVSLSSIIRNHATSGGGGIYNDDETVYLAGNQIRANTPDNCEPLNTITGCAG